jgi:tetratricopeptide (TPR) repeat protein
VRVSLFEVVCLIFALCALAPQACALSPTTATSQPTEADRRHAFDLSRKAADLIDAQKWREAEKALDESLALVPDNYVCLYNLALVHATTGRAAAAMGDLERATDAGFTDFHRLLNDPAFVPLRELPRFDQLLARRDQIKHHAAERMLGELKKSFGDRYRYELDEAHQLVIAARLDQATLDQAAGYLRVEQQSLEEQIFSHPPDELVRVIIASSLDFSKLEHRADVGGHYDDATRTILVKRPGPELRHEYVHALHAADQHALGQEHPVWLSEGLATLYEQPGTTPSTQPASSRMIPSDTWRLARVQASAKHDSLIPIEKLLTLDRAAFTARADLAYGEGGSILLYLYDHQLLKKFYDTYTSGYAKDPSGAAALTQVTGMSLPELQHKWAEWLLPRTVPPRPVPSLTN